MGYSGAGDVVIDNASDISAVAYGNSFALYGYAYDGNTSINNSGTLYAYAYTGLADGIFASGVNTDVSNSGDITAISQNGYFAIGIDAAGDDLTTVSNDGTIYAYTSNIGAPGVHGAESIGIYATGGAGGVQVTTGAGSSIEAQGPYVTGIFAQSGGAASVTNAGDITAGGLYTTSYSYYGNTYYYTEPTSYVATGIHAGSNYPGSDASVDNSGDIKAYGYLGATGVEVLALGSGSNGSVTNSGSILGYEGGGATYGGIGIVVSADNNADIDNSGSIAAVSSGSKYAYAYGAMALAFAGDATVTNSGDITADSGGFFYSGAYGVVAAAQNGEAIVDNSGTIDATSGKYAEGIQASSLNGTTVNNSGSIHADGKYAYGVFATSGQGDVSVANSASGLIDSYSYAGYAAGVFAQSTQGDVSVDNAGDIEVYGYSQGVGVFARSLYADASATNSGYITAITGGSSASAVGILANAAQGNASVSNSGDILASVEGVNGYIGYAAYGVLASGETVDVANSGTITAIGTAYAAGIVAIGNGDVNIANSGGSIDATAPGYVYTSYYYGGTYVYGSVDGINASSATGNVSITNASDITASSTYVDAAGIRASAYGDVAIANSGDTQASSVDGYAFGIYAKAEGDVAIGNSGSIQAMADYQYATGAYGGSLYGDVSVNNSGAVTAYSPYSMAVGLAGASYYGNVAVSNAGTVDATSRDDNAIGLIGNDLAGDVAVSTSASSVITATAASGQATGIFGFSFLGNVAVDNGGSISADGYAAMGVMANALYAGAVTVGNSGDIDVASTTGGSAYGIYATAYGPVMVDNSGAITSTDDDYAVGVAMYSATSTMLLNSGTINTNAAAVDSQIAVLTGDSEDQITNIGMIQGALVTHGGDDAFTSGNGGDWIVDNRSTDFGSGDDALTIMAGGAIHLDEGAIYLGSSTAAGNTFDNDGTIFVAGTSNLIDMGSGTPPPSPSQPVPGGMNALSLPAQAAVPSLNAIAFTNTGLIDFVDGMPDDMLTVVGDFAGSGDINIDVSVLSATSDILYVDGSIVDGSTQTVNVAYEGIPLPTDPDIAFAYVTGDSTADAFVGGQVLDFDPSNFINVKTTVTSSLDASNVNPDVFYIGVSANGLNDTGVLASSVAAGAHSLINSQIGTWRQRVGVLPEQPQGGLSPWVRFFSDKGTVDPTKQSGFGSDSDFSFDQDNWGRELGMNFNLNGSFNYGVLLGKADGKQDLNGGTGTDRLKLNTAGLYATWVSNGFYVDWSYRWMDFDAKLLSAAGEQRTSGNATATNIEAGYSWNVGGFDLIPQAQYTRTKLDNVDVVHGSLTDFETSGGVSERGRVGLGLSKTITSGGMIWTPYGSVNAIREFKGEHRYTVADIYYRPDQHRGHQCNGRVGRGPADRWLLGHRRRQLDRRRRAGQLRRRAGGAAV